MADERITELSAGTPVGTDPFLFVDASDLSMGATGTDKKVALQDIPIDGAMVTTGTVADARIASTIARDSEVTAAVAALSTVYQPLDSDLTAIAALTTTAYGRALLALADAAALRTAAALGDIATQGASNVAITGGSITGITDLAVADGGTGASTAANARTNLGLGTAAVVDTGTSAANVPTITQADARYQPLDSDLTSIAALTTTAFGRAFLAFANTAAVLSALSLDADLATFALPASTTISAYGATLVDDADASTARTTLGLGNAATLTVDADLATFALPASTTISAFGATIVDDANAAATIATLGLDADIATLSLPASTTITAAAATVLDDASTSAMLTTLGAQPLDSDLTTIAGLTATTDNFLVSVASAWASRTPAQVKSTLAIAESDVTNLTTDLGALQTQTMLQAAKIEAAKNAAAGYYVGAGLDYFASATTGKLDRHSGNVLVGTVEARGDAATAIGSTVATLGTALTSGQAMWVNVELDSSAASQYNSGSAATAALAQIPTTTAGRTIAGWIYIPQGATVIDTDLTNANGNAKFIDARVVRPGPSFTGWAYDLNTWTYVSATTGAGGGLGTYKITGVDATGYLKPGDMVSWYDGAVQYGMIDTVTFSTDTTIALVKTSDYTLSGSAITNPRYAHAGTPVGYPKEFEWIPTLAGWSVNPGRQVLTSVSSTIATSKLTKTAHGLVTGDFVTPFGIATTTGISNGTTYYAIRLDADNVQVTATPGGSAITFGGTADAAITIVQVGRHYWGPAHLGKIWLEVRHAASGTSNNATHSATLPATAKTISGMSWGVATSGVDNGSIVAGFSIVASAGTVVNLHGTTGATSTSSGTSRVAIQPRLVYDLST